MADFIVGLLIGAVGGAFIGGFIADIKDSSEYETKIKSLEDRVKELEDKNK